MVQNKAILVALEGPEYSSNIMNILVGVRNINFEKQRSYILSSVTNRVEPP
jgi:hypothetical protein